MGFQSRNCFYITPRIRSARKLLRQLSFSLSLSLSFSIFLHLLFRLISIPTYRIIGNRSNVFRQKRRSKDLLSFVEISRFVTFRKDHVQMGKLQAETGGKTSNYPKSAGTLNFPINLKCRLHRRVSRVESSSD